MTSSAPSSTQRPFSGLYTWVPLIMTVCAGRFTPQARVDVETKTWMCLSANRSSTSVLSTLHHHHHQKQFVVRRLQRCITLSVKPEVLAIKSGVRKGCFQPSAKTQHNLNHPSSIPLHSAAAITSSSMIFEPKRVPNRHVVIVHHAASALRQRHARRSTGVSAPPTSQCWTPPPDWSTEKVDASTSHRSCESFTGFGPESVSTSNSLSSSSGVFMVWRRATYPMTYVASSTPTVGDCVHHRRPYWLSDQRSWWPWATVLFRLPAVDSGTVYRMKSRLPPHSLSSAVVLRHTFTSFHFLPTRLYLYSGLAVCR